MQPDLFTLCSQVGHLRKANCTHEAPLGFLPLPSGAAFPPRRGAGLEVATGVRGGGGGETLAWPYNVPTRKVRLREGLERQECVTGSIPAGALAGPASASGFELCTPELV